jgi:hypothetical protein
MRASSPHARFAAHRQLMLTAFSEWITEDRPPAADVAMEVDGTCSAVCQVVQLLAAVSP